jgi:hypothetical protein
MVMSSGPFSLNPGATKTLDYAFVFSWDRADTNSAATSVAKNHHDVMQIKSWFDNNNYPCHTETIGIDEIVRQDVSFIVYPNPATGSVIVNIAGKFSGSTTLQLFDVAGRVILSEKNIPAKTTLDIGGFDSGLYFVTLSDATHSATKKIVVR